MKAVITVIGKDMVGILAKVCTICEEYNVNVLEVSQNVLDDLFAMVMLADISKCNVDFTDFTGKFEPLATKLNLQIHVMHEDIFNSMHKI